MPVKTGDAVPKSITASLQVDTMGVRLQIRKAEIQT